MIHLGRSTYPYMEEVNEGIVRAFEHVQRREGFVLDVGCGRAALGAAISHLGWNVWGVEQNQEACEAARARLDRLIEADLHNYDSVRAALAGKQVDALVFSDVLEHVYDPRAALESYLSFLRPGGTLLISVPNAVVWTNRLRWFFGRVRYTDTGVMDRTHIRFFTFRTARELVAASGCQVRQVTSTPYLARALLPLVKRAVGSGSDNGTNNPRAVIDSSAYRWYMRRIYPIERTVASLWPTLLAFRIIIRATKPSEATGEAKP
jgi:2-polyprenyl-3-methyl-5-hydroxy-6-metoxy-1,4-benzoquinol methylase